MIPKRKITTTVAIAVAAVSLTVPAAAEQKVSRHARQKMDRAVQEALAEGAGRYRVIVRAASGHAAALRDEVRRHGGKVVAQHPSIDAFTIEVDVNAVTRLAESDAVVGLSSDADVEPTAVTPAPASS